MSAISKESVWRVGTVVEIRDETHNAKTFVFRLEEPVVHLAGAHYELRLTSEDGYQATRLYSAASIGSGDHLLELTIALVSNGEVTGYLFDYVVVGAQIELRGPLTHFFVWDPAQPRPALLIGGGSGVVPMRAMIRAHQAAGATTPMTLLYSCRTADDIIYRRELEVLAPPLKAIISLSDAQPAGWTGRAGFIDKNLIAPELATLGPDAVCYLCGSTPFVEAMANILVELGVENDRIKAERFGPMA